MTEPRGAERGESYEVIRFQITQVERDRHAFEAARRANIARYRYQIGSSGYWVECPSSQALVVHPDGHEEIQNGMRLFDDPAPQPTEGGAS